MREVCFGEVTNDGPLGGLNTSTGQWGPFLSYDWPRAGSKLYFADTAGGNDLWEATWEPDPVLEVVDDFEDGEVFDGAPDRHPSPPVRSLRGDFGFRADVAGDGARAVLPPEPAPR